VISVHLLLRQPQAVSCPFRARRDSVRIVAKDQFSRPQEL
jgi:hypothetical protein